MASGTDGTGTTSSTYDIAPGMEVTAYATSGEHSVGVTVTAHSPRNHVGEIPIVVENGTGDLLDSRIATVPPYGLAYTKECAAEQAEMITVSTSLRVNLVVISGSASAEPLPPPETEPWTEPVRPVGTTPPPVVIVEASARFGCSDLVVPGPVH